jgi:hypothetical protein
MDEPEPGPSVERVAETKRELIFEIDETQFQLWRHERISAAFLQFVEDQIAEFRELAAICVEHGYFTRGDAHEDRNPDVVRGKIIALKQLHNLSLMDIQRFYKPDDADESAPAPGLEAED